MRKKIIVGLGSVLAFSAVKALAVTLLASPGYTYPGCSWSTLSSSTYSPGVSVNVSGFSCGTGNPLLVKTVVTQPNGQSSCTMSASGNTTFFIYSNQLTCTDYFVYGK